jgi:nicotinamidase-related amidase
VRLIPKEVGPEPGDFVISDGAELHRFLARRGILHLFYLGFASNDCMLHKDYAIVAMRRRGYNAMLVRDCTTGIEAARSFSGFSATEMAIQDIEFHNATTTSEELIRACGGSGGEAHSERGGRAKGNNA